MSIPVFSSSSAGKVKENKDVAQPLKDFGLRISKLLVRDRTGLFYVACVNFQPLFDEVFCGDSVVIRCFTNVTESR